MADVLGRLADAKPEQRAKVESVLMGGFKLRLSQIRAALGAEAVSLKTLPEDIVSDWTTADGRARIEVGPKATATTTPISARFADRRC